MADSADKEPPALMGMQLSNVVILQLNKRVLCYSDLL